MITQKVPQPPPKAIRKLSFNEFKVVHPVGLLGTQQTLLESAPLYFLRIDAASALSDLNGVELENLITGKHQLTHLVHQLIQMSNIDADGNSATEPPFAGDAEFASPAAVLAV